MQPRRHSSSTVWAISALPWVLCSSLPPWQRRLQGRVPCSQHAATRHGDGHRPAAVSRGTGKSAQIPLYVWLPDAMEVRPRSARSSTRRPWSRPASIWWPAATLSLRHPLGAELGDVDWRDHRPVRSNHRYAPEGSKARPGLFDDQPDRLHVPGHGCRSLRGGHVSPDDSCFLQGAALPVRRQRNARPGRGARYL